MDAEILFFIFLYIIFPFGTTLLCVIACQDRRERWLRRAAEPAQVASASNTQNIATGMNAVKPFKYMEDRRRGDEEAPESSTAVTPECVICLSEVVEGEVVKKLPNCMHMFHADCIDMWLFSHQICPVCRSPVQPSSVVPVAF